MAMAGEFSKAGTESGRRALSASQSGSRFAADMEHVEERPATIEEEIGPQPQVHEERVPAISVQSRFWGRLRGRGAF